MVIGFCHFCNKPIEVDKDKKERDFIFIGEREKILIHKDCYLKMLYPNLAQSEDREGISGQRCLSCDG